MKEILYWNESSKEAEQRKKRELEQMYNQVKKKNERL